jgi:acetyltransferase-like isoleucine patch superfamily enzyme
MHALTRLKNRFRRSGMTPAAPLTEDPPASPPVATARKPGSLSLKQAVEVGILTLGTHSYGGASLVVFPGDDAKARIGKYCSLAEGVELMPGGNHRPEWVTTYPLRVMFDLPGALRDGLPASKGDIVIGNEVWIGADAKVLSGVRVGDGAVIGAGAVVAADVRPYAIVVGNPAREIRRRFADAEVEALLRISWWDWPDELVVDRVADLSNPDVRGFIERFDQPTPG